MTAYKQSCQFFLLFTFILMEKLLFYAPYLTLISKRKMTKRILLLLLLFIPFFASAQYSIGYNKSGKLRKISKIKDAKLDILKGTTTAFVIPERDSANLQKYEQAIKSVWTITPFIIIYPNEINRYSNKKGFSIFKYRVYTQTSSVDFNNPASTKASIMFLTYELWIPDAKKKDKIKSHILAGIELYPESDFIKDFYRHRNFTKKQDLEDQLTTLSYKTFVVYNWGPGFLKGYLKTINDALINKDTRNAGMENTETDRLKTLKNDTLYVPDYVLIKYNKFTANEREKEVDDEDLANAYPHPVKFLPATELNDLILQADHPVKYLVYCKSSTEKYVHVYDSKDGVLIFSRGSFMSYNFKYKDLHKLSKAID